MNEARAALVVGLLASMIVACSHDDTTKLTTAAGAAVTTPAPAAAPASTAAPEDAPVCPSDMPAAKQLVKDANAHAVQVAGDQIYFQSMTGLLKVGFDGSGPHTVLASPSITQGWVQGEFVVVVDSPDPPDATVRILPLATASTADDDGTAIDVALPDTWNAAGTKVFASDATGFFLVGDSEAGNGIYQLTNDGTLTELVAPDKSIVTSLQVSDDAIWFVRDNAHVLKLDRPKLDADGNVLEKLNDKTSPAKEAFAVDASGCDLVVAASHALCVKPSVVEEHDLTGANATPLLDLTKSRVQAPLGIGVGAGDSLVLGSSSVIRMVKVADASEHIVACARDGINSVDAGPSQIAWSEQGKEAGIWLAAR